MSVDTQMGNTGLSRSQKAAQKVFGLLNSRKKWLIHPRFQLKVIFFGVTIAGFGLVLSYLAIHYFFSQCVQTLVSVGMPTSHPVYEFVRAQQGYLNMIYLGVGGLSLLFSSAVGLVLSHRVAGPLYRMKEHLLETAAGRSPRPLKFREKDYFQELAEAYNAELQSRGTARRPGSEPNRIEESSSDQSAA